MRVATGLSLAVLFLAVPTMAFAQGKPGSTVETIDKAGEAASMKGAPGTLVPDTPGAAVAPGIAAPVETPVKPQPGSRDPAPAAK